MSLHDECKDTFFIRDSELHHLKNVLRLNKNDIVYGIGEDKQEYKGKIIEINNNEAICSILEKSNIKIYYNSRKHRFSSSELRQRTYQSEMAKSLMPISNGGIRNEQNLY